MPHCALEEYLGSHDPVTYWFGVRHWASFIWKSKDREVVINVIYSFEEKEYRFPP